MNSSDQADATQGLPGEGDLDFGTFGDWDPDNSLGDDDQLAYFFENEDSAQSGSDNLPVPEPGAAQSIYPSTPDTTNITQEMMDQSISQDDTAQNSCPDALRVNGDRSGSTILTAGQAQPAVAPSVQLRAQGDAQRKPQELAPHPRLQAVLPWAPSSTWHEQVQKNVFEHYRKHHPFSIQLDAVGIFHRINKIPGIPQDPSPLHRAKYWAQEISLQKIERQGIFEDLMTQMAVTSEESDLELFKQTYQYAACVARQLRDRRQINSREPWFQKAFESEMTKAMVSEVKQGKSLDCDDVEALRHEVIIKLEIKAVAEANAKKVGGLEAETSRILNETIENLRNSNIKVDPQMYQNLLEGAEKTARSRLGASPALSFQNSSQRQPLPVLGQRPSAVAVAVATQERPVAGDRRNDNSTDDIPLPDHLRGPPPRSHFDDPRNVTALASRVTAERAGSKTPKKAVASTPSSPNKKRARASASDDPEEPSPKRPGAKRPSTKRSGAKRTSKGFAAQEDSSPSSGSDGGITIHEDGRITFEIKNMAAARAHVARYGGNSGPGPVVTQKPSTGATDSQGHNAEATSSFNPSNVSYAISDPQQNQQQYQRSFGMTKEPGTEAAGRPEIQSADIQNMDSTAGGLDDLFLANDLSFNLGDGELDEQTWLAELGLM